MNIVEDNQKKYEAISMHADPLYLKFKNSIDIVKQFVRDRKLVIYGGTAIDYALRLRGDNIYPDESLAVPDLDMYSPDIVGDAYALADILYAAGYTEVRCVVGRYVRVMKVDIGDKHFVADIAFLAKSVFDLVPTVEYEGMRVVHPNFQRVDIHSSLTYPFDGAPMEVIFNRWNKDISRFNKLHDAYPIEATGAIPAGIIRPVKIERRIISEVFAGFAAYTMCYQVLVKLVGADAVDSAGIIRATYSLDNEYLTVDVPFDKVEFLHHTPKQFIGKYPADYQKYASVGSMLPKHWVGDVHGINVTLYSGAHRYTCVGFIDNGIPPRLKFTGVQWLLSYFIAGYLFTPLFIKGTKNVDLAVAKELFLGYYLSTLKMVSMAESALVDKVGSMTDDDVNKSVFLPNTYVYGNDNQSENQIIQNQTTLALRAGTPVMKPLPTNYYPARRNPHPKFDYNASEYFIKDGRPLYDEPKK